MDRFTPLHSALGGLLIGLSSIALILFNGRVAGISGILGGAIAPDDDDRVWRLLFVAGLLAGGLVIWLLQPTAFAASAPDASLGITVIAGLLVGFGTRLGSGCTSGHGVSGIARFSKRSIVATAVFMVTGAATVFVMRHGLGVAR